MPEEVTIMSSHGKLPCEDFSISNRGKSSKAAADQRYYRKHKAKIRIRKREWQRRNMKRICLKNTRRKKTDVHYHITCNLRARLNQAIRKCYKAGSAINDLGCSVEEFKSYITTLFKEGMRWENYGEWHLDHVKPLCSFDLTKRDEFVKAVHYTNYQPLWAEDNWSKNGRYDSNHQHAAS